MSRPPKLHRFDLLDTDERFDPTPLLFAILLELEHSPGDVKRVLNVLEQESEFVRASVLTWPENERPSRDGQIEMRNAANNASRLFDGQAAGALPEPVFRSEPSPEELIAATALRSLARSTLWGLA